jgi:flagellar basal-body rod modification protein FlgD
MATSFDTTLSALGIGRAAAPTNARSKSTEEMTSKDFVELMIAQLKNQDPFEPVDNTQMVAQMAQFSNLSATTEMASTLKTIAAKLNATTTGEALAFVGKTVLTEGKVAYPRAAGGLAGGVELAAPASNVLLTISDANGAVVKSVDLGAQGAGVVNFDWDGMNEAGGPAGSGPFTLTAQARDGGKSVTSRTLVWAPVTSVSMPSGGAAQLTLPGIGQVPVTAVRAIG